MFNREDEEGRGTFRILLLILFIALPVAGGLLSFLEAIYDGDGDVQALAGAFAVASAPNGSQVYVASWTDSSLTVFQCDEASGTLSHQQSLVDNSGVVDGMANPLDVAASPDGKFVYVASYGDDAVTVFERVEPPVGTVELQYHSSVYNNSGGVFMLGGASAVAVTPDSGYVLATSWDDESLLVFTRDATSDNLVLVDVENQWTSTPSMAGASAIAVSPDGQNIYVSSYANHRILGFGWDPSQDGVVYTGVVEDGVDGVSGLRGPRDVVVDPAGNFVYASGRLDHSVVIFERDERGTLSFVGRVEDGVGGVSHLSDPFGLAVSPVGSALFVSSGADGAVVVFSRDQNTGALTQVEEHLDGVSGVHGLSSARYLSVNPELLQLYVTGFSDGALVSFDLSTAVFSDGFETGDTDGWSAAYP